MALERSNLDWSSAAADWRLGLCMANAKVRKRHVPYMYQSNEQLDCVPYSGSGCSWGGSYNDHVVECPLTLHYQTPAQMRRLHRRAAGQPVCIPIPPPPWLDISTHCDCVPFASRGDPRQRDAEPPAEGARPSQAQVAAFLTELLRRNASALAGPRPLVVASRLLSAHFRSRIPAGRAGGRALRQLIATVTAEGATTGGRAARG